MNEKIKPQRVAILGGGIAGLTAALELSDPAQQGRYEVTIYQTGWRLGGKCASGRNIAKDGRIEEHGLHVFFGFYDNTFEMLRKVYAELARDPASAFPTVFDAVAPHNTMTLLEQRHGTWKPWTITCPGLPGRPGDGEPPGPWATIRAAIEWLAGRHADLKTRAGSAPPPSGAKPHWWDRLFARVTHPADGDAMDAVRTATTSLPEDASLHLPEHHHRLADMLESGWRTIAGLVIHPEAIAEDLRHLVIEADLVRAVLTGLLREGFLSYPYAATDAANALDFRDWLTRHGAMDVTVQSVPVRALYDLIFAYPDGDITRPGQVEAGSMVNALMQLWQYRGAVCWKMRAGTGDVVVAPIYEVLRKRGVRVEFFSRVAEIVPDAGGASIRRIAISRQVRLKGTSYDPLVTLGTLPCWPSAPLYDQIVEGQALQARGINLESRWSGWEDTGGTLHLEAGADFDFAILAISKAGLSDICAGLIAQKAPWRDMMAAVRTVETQNVQLHLTRSLKDCGWNGPAGSLAGGYDLSPLDTWADISEVLPAEGGTAKAHVILCGPLKGPSDLPPPDDKGYPVQATATVRAEAQRFLSTATAAIWPAVNGPNGFDWSVLEASAATTGPDRLDAQYIRANVDPSERYVQSVPGSSSRRLRTDGSGYANLYLAGDWIATPQNLGSFEASVMAGKLASRGISGLPERLLRVPPDHPLMSRHNPGPVGSGPSAPYVVHGGVQTFAGPIRFEQAKMWVFVVKANAGRLQDLCAKFFSGPSDGAVDYVPLTDRVVLSLTEIPKGRFENYPSMGYASEKELAVWVFAGRRKAPGSPVIERIGAFSPYLFLDNPVARSTGREVYGYLKQLGWIRSQGTGGALPSFQIDAYGTPDIGPEARWDRQRFITIDPVTPGQMAAGTAFSEIGELAQIAEKALDASGTWLLPGLGMIEQVVEAMKRGQVSQIFLKQFRDIRRTDLACYQAIAEAPAFVSNINGLHHPGQYRFRAQTLANIPLCEELGIEADCVTDLTLSLTLDMVIDPGSVVWEK